MMKKWILFLLCGGCGLVMAQDDSFESLSKKYADKLAVCIKEKETVKFSVVKGELQISSVMEEETLYLTDKAPAFSKREIYFSGFTPLSKIEAKTYVPAKNGFKAVAVKEFQEKSVETEGIFFDDLQAIYFVYPSMQKGAKTALTYQRTFSDPRLLNAYHFGRGVPVLESTLTLVVDKQVEISFTEFNLKGLDVSFTKEDKGKEIIYNWTIRNLLDRTREDDAPDFRYSSPHVIYHVARYKNQDKEVPVLSSVNDWYAWYWSMVDSIHVDETGQLKMLVDSITAGVSNDREKADRMYNWVQNNIRYVAFEDGMRGFIPHKASYVYEKKFGDCKDMSSLLHRMYTIAGIKSHLTWVGTRDLPYTYNEIPTPNVDNHMIVAVDLGEGMEFVDATAKYTALGYPSSMIQGKEALISLDDKSFEVKQVPVVPMEKNVFSDSVWINLTAENQLKGTGKLHLTGFPRIMWNGALTGVNANRLKDNVRQMLGKSHNKYFVDTFSLSNVDTWNAPLTADYSFRLEDYAKSLGNETYLNLNLDRFLNHRKIEVSSRKNPVENDYRYINKVVTCFQVPEGHQVSYTPPDASFKADKFGFDITYKEEKGVIYQTKSVYMNHLLLEKEDYDSWNKMINELANAYSEAIILKKSE